MQYNSIAISRMNLNKKNFKLFLLNITYIKKKSYICRIIKI